MRNALLKTTAISALIVAAFSTAHAATISEAYTLNPAHTSGIPITVDIGTGTPLTGNPLASAAHYLADTSVNAWCSTASLCTSYSTSTGQFQSNQPGGILKQLLQVLTTLPTVATFSPPLPLNIKLHFPNWYTLPNTMDFRFPKVVKTYGSNDVAGTAAITASEWNSCIAVGFSMQVSYVSQNLLAYSQLPLPTEETFSPSTVSSLYGALQTMLQIASAPPAYSISISNDGFGSYQMPSFTVYTGGSSDRVTSASTVSVLCKIFY